MKNARVEHLALVALLALFGIMTLSSLVFTTWLLTHW